MQRGVADVRIHVDMHTCNGACTHFNQGEEPEKGDWDMYTGLHQAAHVFM